MFEFFFQHPWAAWRQGTFLWASGWPAWVLGLMVLVAAAGVAWLFSRKTLVAKRKWTLAGLQWAALAVLLVLLWRPALSVSVLEQQQNVVAVVVDDSKSMAREGRLTEAKRLLEGELLGKLRAKFPVRLYTAGGGLKRVDGVPGEAVGGATDLGNSLKEAVGEAATLPVGAIVLLSDGADNKGGLDAETMAEVRRSRIPVHTVGFGRERIEKDVEVAGVEVAARALPGAKLEAAVTLRQSGFAGQTVKLTVADGAKTLGSKVVKLGADGERQREMVTFAAGEAGARTLKVGVTLLDGETNRENNTVSQLLQVEDRVPRILYFEGEPRWEMKFVRRAAEEDKQLALVSIVRTTQNKLYRQGIENPKEVEGGFPEKVEELFRYDAVVIGNVESTYFSAAQQALLREFASRRGGGALFLGGRAALSEGGWNHSAVEEMLPVAIVDRKGTFHREPAGVELTAAGKESLVTRVEEGLEQNAARWKGFPKLADYQETGAVKPGAVVLAEALPASGGRVPLLVTQSYGRGRVAVFATGGSWKWRMLQPSTDGSFYQFWRQMLRWLAGQSGGRVTAQVSKALYADESRVALRAEARDLNYLPEPGATVEARILGPSNASATVPLSASAEEPGVFTGEWKAEAAGTYVVEMVARNGERELGRDVVHFLREDGVAEQFRTEQNRELLERVAALTGGRYYTPGEAGRMANEIAFSPAGITTKRALELWNMPAALLLLAGLKAAEWLLRRRWGAV